MSCFFEFKLQDSVVSVDAICLDVFAWSYYPIMLCPSPPLLSTTFFGFLHIIHTTNHVYVNLTISSNMIFLFSSSLTTTDLLEFFYVYSFLFWIICPFRSWFLSNEASQLSTFSLTFSFISKLALHLCNWHNVSQHIEFSGWVFN
jgi:hypothetical protein